MRRLANRTAWALCVIGAAWLLTGKVDGQSPPASPASPPAATQPGQQPLDLALSWMHDAKRNYSAVKDYTCTLVSKENIRGEMKEESIAQMKFRTQPFSVYMRWLAPSKLAGQEVAFCHGKNDNKMRVQSKGLLKVVGFVSIDVHDPRVTEHSRHTILEAGMGNLIDTTIRHWTIEQKVGKTECKIAEFEYAGRRCYRIETTRPERQPGVYSHRTIIYVDKDSKLPIRNESYDWPRQGGPAGGDLLESYSLVDLRFNVGLTDRDFVK